jgi:protocatechuate 3,4-dioxygenase beta subunit
MNSPAAVEERRFRALAFICVPNLATQSSDRKELIIMRVDHRETDLENHDRGLDHDLPRLLQRRGMLKLVLGAGLVGMGLVALGACADSTTTTGAGATGAPSRGPGGAPPGGGQGQSADTSDTANGEIPEETSGPYPGDGSNGANVLTESGMVRSDITSSFGSSTTKATGLPLSITMTINDFANNKKPLSGGAVYLWHCDQAGQYSLYSQAAVNENYLRGVQQTDASGKVTFTSIFPACYSGRWPHIHFEVYPSLAKATSSANKIATSQLALTEEACKAVYATAGYEQSLQNLGKVSLATDNVFSDGYDLEIPTITGDPTKGYSLDFTCAV